MTLRDLSVEEARQRMLAAVSPLAAETVALDRTALGRVLAEPIRAVRDQPPYDTSAMDGYAIRIGDSSEDFQLVGESAAGRPCTDDIAPGCAVRVFTGAHVQSGCAVVIQEQARRDGKRVRFEALPNARSNVRLRGGDFHAGEVLLGAGTRLDAWRLGLAAAAGRAQAEVRERPRVAVISTGEEIVKAGGVNVAASRIFDSNGPALSALIAGWGGAPIGLEPVRDDLDAIVAAVADVVAELIVTVGGASVGDYDLVKPALARLGLELAVETISLRPGKPTWFGRLADGRCVLGLPGNPASSLVAAELFLRPLLMAWQGTDTSLPMTHACLTAPLRETGPREHWMRAKLESGEDGRVLATPFADQDSSLVGVFAAADALLRRPAGALAANTGDVVEVLRLARL